MKTLVWIDDLRDPKTEIWSDWISHFYDISDLNIIWVKSFIEFTNYIDNNDCPDIICFDHDLGDINNMYPEAEKTGYSCALYLVDYCEDNNIDIPDFRIQSSNPVGQEKISGLLNNYHKFYIKNK